MVEIKIELPPSKLLSTSIGFALLTELEIEALVYVLQKLTQAWALKGIRPDER